MHRFRFCTQTTAILTHDLYFNCSPSYRTVTPMHLDRTHYKLEDMTSKLRVIKFFVESKVCPSFLAFINLRFTSRIIRNMTLILVSRKFYTPLNMHRLLVAYRDVNI